MQALEASLILGDLEFTAYMHSRELQSSSLTQVIKSHTYCSFRSIKSGIHNDIKTNFKMEFDLSELPPFAPDQSSRRPTYTYIHDVTFI